MSDKNEIERRINPLGSLEFREGVEDENPSRLIGYAALFDKLSDDLGGFREQIAFGAFSKSLSNDVRALFNHDANQVLGRTKSKTLSLREDQRGLHIEITPPDTNLANDLMKSVQRGDVDQMSFGFRTVKDSWDEVDGEIIRTLLEVRLFDVSPVTFPAYPQTELALRSMGDWQDGLIFSPPDHSIHRRRLDLLSI